MGNHIKRIRDSLAWIQETGSESLSISGSGSGGGNFNELMAYLSKGLVVDDTAESFDLVQWCRARD
ncbi:hypothetical protein L484_000279 [Morus notabilis]|uniref:Uncharacterized protein n=1 Tax=Morus notabilis TaxID=981085 RepID=W9RIE5_9ROSA|nr:hypothetical protein L484_000279 [Morus notabilis]